MNMDAQLKLDKVLEEIGLTAKCEAKAEERKAFSIAQNMVARGYPIEDIASVTMLDPKKVKALYSR